MKIVMKTTGRLIDIITAYRYNYYIGICHDH